MGRAPRTTFEEELAEFFGETAHSDSQSPLRDHVTFQPAERTPGPLLAGSKRRPPPLAGDR
jgi:hypothetical protein